MRRLYTPFFGFLICILGAGYLIINESAVTAYAATNDLFFSEYIEGSSNNKALEIYNGTGAPIDLSTYNVELYSNGNPGPPTNSATLSGILADGDVFVLASTSSTLDPAISAQADLLSAVVNFNGNDAVAIRKGGAIIDVIGVIGSDPGTEWGSGDASTQNNTIRRLWTVCQGDANGFDNPSDISDQWQGFPNDTFDGLGAHSVTCDGTQPTPTPTATPTDPPPAIDGLVINEIDYDQDSTDTAEFLELYNSSSSSINLAANTLTFINGSNDSTYMSIPLPNVDLAAGDFFVVCADSTTVANCDLDVDPNSNLIQNGAPDAVALESSGQVIDSVSYEGSVAAPYVEGTGAGTDDPDNDNAGLSRLPDGADTNDNSADFSVRCSTPGVANSVESSSCPTIAPPSLPALLLTELIVTPTGGEFIEIYNPTDGPVDLSNVYLTDGTFADGNVYYYNIVTGADAGGGGFGDFHALFPAGAIIQPGEYQTISLAGSARFSAAYNGIAPTYELFDDGTANGEAQMLEATPGSINGQGGLTNDGEVAILYYWDGTSDLVADLDYALWGDKAEAVDKTNIAIDGPDTDSDSASYLPDTAITEQDVIASGAHAADQSWQRSDLTEGAEAQSGGNSTTGSNEMSEDLSNTWCEAAPTPGAESKCDTNGGDIGQCLDGNATLISNIQGEGATTPLNGQLVIVEGVVTGDFQDGIGTDGDLNGFYIQEEESDSDGNALTSEGIFVFQGNNPDVDISVNDLVRVLGTAVEYETSNGASSLTQINNIRDLIICGAALTITPTDLMLPVAAISDLERYEGMLVRLPQELVISEYFNFDRFNETVLVLPLGGEDRPYQPTAIHEPGSQEAAARADLNERSRITLDDGRNSQNSVPAIHPNGGVFTFTNTFRGGDLVADAVGVVDDSFGLYRVQPTVGADFTPINPRPSSPADVGGTLKVASINVLNYFTTLGDGEICGASQTLECRGAHTPEDFERQRIKIIEAIAAIDADVVGLVEIENTPDADAVQDLVDGLNDKLGAGTYAAIDTGVNGTDAIKVGLIYQPATVSPLGTYALLDDQSFTDPNLTGQQKNRPALAQSFTESATGAAFTVAVNHLKSKSSGCGAGDDDPEQGNCNGTRTAAAQALATWLATDPTDSGDPDFMIIGDLNAYDKEDPITVLTDAGYTDLIHEFGGEFAYSYVFSGQFGYLDYALANESLTAQVTGITEWHINADEPDIWSYDTRFTDPGFFEENAFRASDHDPVIVGMKLDSSSQADDFYYVSFSRSGKIGDLRFRDEDILGYNLTTGDWSLVFDGSDLVPSFGDINAFHINDDGSILMSFAIPVKVPGVGLVRGRDIVRFVPTSLGTQTAGTFELYLDGNSVGLNKASENVDAIGITPDGQLVVSTLSNASVPGIGGSFSARDEDLLKLDSNNQWSLYFDGSDVGLTERTEDLWALWIDAGGDLYLSTLANFSAGGVSGEGNDVFVCTPSELGDNTLCAIDLLLDGDAIGIERQVIDGHSVGPSLMHSISRAAEVDEMAIEENDAISDDILSVEDVVDVIFLPLINQ